MSFTKSNSWLNSPILGDGEYYVFCQQQGEEIRLGYLFTSWCIDHYRMHMKFSAVELGEPLPLIKIDENLNDKGKLKTFDFNSRNLLLIDDAYNRATAWLNKMQAELNYLQLDENTSVTPAVIVVNKGALSAFYEKNDFFKVYFETFNVLR